MTGIFLKILEMSATACIVILAAVVIRALLKKAPRIFSYILWAAVFFRLLCPVVPEAPIGGVVPVELPATEVYTAPEKAENTPDKTVSINAGEVKPGMTAFVSVPDSTAPAGSGAADILAVIWAAGAPAADTPVKNDAAGFMDIFVNVSAAIWLTGAAAMLANGAVALIRLKLRLRGAVCADGIYISDRIKNPFILGFFRPKIVLPDGLSANSREIILLHEKTHIRRLDHIVKLIMYVALCLHWFNPLVWLCFRLCEKDMEMSADQQVTVDMRPEQRAEYTQVLLDITAKRPAAFTACFGENNVKQRVENILYYKVPPLWVTVLCTVVTASAVAFMVTDRAAEKPDAADTPAAAAAGGTASVSPDALSAHIFKTEKIIITDKLYEELINAEQSANYWRTIEEYTHYSHSDRVKTRWVKLTAEDPHVGKSGNDLTVVFPESFQGCAHDGLMFEEYFGSADAVKSFKDQYIELSEIASGNYVDERDRCVIRCNKCNITYVYAISYEDIQEDETTHYIRRPAANVRTDTAG